MSKSEEFAQRIAADEFGSIILHCEGEAFFEKIGSESVINAPALFEMELRRGMKKLHRSSKEFILQRLYTSPEYRQEFINELMNYADSMNSVLEAIVMKRNKPISDVAEMVAVRIAERKIANLAGIC